MKGLERQIKNILLFLIIKGVKSYIKIILLIFPKKFLFKASCYFEPKNDVLL